MIYNIHFDRSLFEHSFLCLPHKEKNQKKSHRCASSFTQNENDAKICKASLNKFLTLSFPLGPKLRMLMRINSNKAISYSDSFNGIISINERALAGKSAPAFSLCGESDFLDSCLPAGRFWLLFNQEKSNIK